MDVPSRRWSLLLVGKTNGIVAQVDHDWSKHPDHYEKVVVVEEEHANREIERLRAELAECKRDAERYRWLRRARMNVDVLVREDEDSVWIDMHGWDLDAYVDAALAAKEE